MQSTESIPDRKQAQILISQWMPFYSNKEQRQVPGVIALDAELYDYLFKIRDGEFKEKAEVLRAIEDPQQKKNYKTENLPALTISGRFKSPRGEKNLTAHSGCLCVDTDSSSNPHIEDWKAERDRQTDSCPSTVACFVSVSGKGVALIVKIDPSKHVETFEYLEWLMLKHGIVIDPAPKNIASLRFVSYDPEIYIDTDFASIPVVTPTSEFYQYRKEKEEKLKSVRQQARPVSATNDVSLFLNGASEAAVHRYELKRGLGTRLIQFMAGYCNSRGMDSIACIEHFINHYGTDSYYTEDNISDRITDMYERYKHQHGTVSTSLKIEISFFDITSDKKRKLTISVNRVRFIDFLHSQGIRLFFADSKVYVFSKITGCFIEEITIEQIKKIVQAHILTLPETFDCGTSKNELLEFLYKGSDNYFGRGFLEFLDRFEPNFLKDTKDTAYLPFRNGVVCVTAEDITLLPYEKVNNHLWKNSIIDFDINLHDSKRSGVWYQFLSCICGNPDPTKLTVEQTDNFFYLLSLTGYLIHRYKDPARPFAVILAEATETEEKGGGTGKGLFCEGVEKIASTCTIPGKSFDPNRPFAWQRVHLHHVLVVIDDVPKKFPFDAIYNAITDGIAIERKNQPEIFIDYESTPKIVLISNYVITSTGNHAERRQRIFEFSQFFSPKYTPEQHFNHILFQDWNQDEWNCFYNTQIACVMMYLKNGLRQSEKSSVLKKREVRQEYGEEFTLWFDYYSQNGCENWSSISKLHEEFLTSSGMEKSDFSVKRFRSGIVSGSRTLGQDFEHRRNKDEKNRTEVCVVKKIRT